MHEGFDKNYNQTVQISISDKVKYSCMFLYLFVRLPAKPSVINILIIPDRLTIVEGPARDWQRRATARAAARARPDLVRRVSPYRAAQAHGTIRRLKAL